MRKYGCATVVVLLAAGAAAGCGGEEALTKSEFLKQGNAICAKGGKQIDAAAEKTFSKGEPSKKEITKFAEEDAIPNIDKQVSDLRELEPPKDDKDKVKKILDSADDALKKVKDDPAIFAAGKDPFADTNKLALDYGLKRCAE